MTQGVVRLPGARRRGWQPSRPIFPGARPLPGADPQLFPRVRLVSSLYSSGKVRKIGLEKEIRATNVYSDFPLHLLMATKFWRRLRLYGGYEGRTERALALNIEGNLFREYYRRTKEGACKGWGGTLSPPPALLGEDNTARLWDVATGEEIRRLKGHTDVVISAAFSPDGAMVVTASGDQTARLRPSIEGLLALGSSRIKMIPKM